jgi:hypothetical protein
MACPSASELADEWRLFPGHRGTEKHRDHREENLRAEKMNDSFL